jgi:2'-5' RNA ligase
MNQQLALFPNFEPVQNRYGLFLSIFPDSGATDLICEQRPGLCKKLRLSGKPRPRGHLHVSLHRFGTYPNFPAQAVAAAVNACASVLPGKQSFEVTFDHAMSFRHRSGDFPLLNWRSINWRVEEPQSLFRTSPCFTISSLSHGNQLTA